MASTSVQDAIKQAREAAAEAAAQAVVEHEPQTNQVAAYNPPSAPASYAAPSMDTMGMSTGISRVVEDWLKVNEYGITFGADRTLFQNVKIKIDMTEGAGFFVKHSIKFGNPAQYFSSYDGTTCDRGGLWTDAVVKAQRADPKASPFAAADIIMILAEDIKLKDKTLPADTKIGHTTSTSNWQDWAEFYREVAKAGLLGTEVATTVSMEAVTGKKNGYTWGILKFKLGH